MLYKRSLSGPQQYVTMLGRCSSLRRLSLTGLRELRPEQVWLEAEERIREADTCAHATRIANGGWPRDHGEIESGMMFPLCQVTTKNIDILC